jgi:hypothetical protein
LVFCHRPLHLQVPLVSVLPSPIVTAPPGSYADGRDRLKSVNRTLFEARTSVVVGQTSQIAGVLTSSKFQCPIAPPEIDNTSCSGFSRPRGSPVGTAEALHRSWTYGG